MNGLGGRIAKLEERDPEPGRNVLIGVRFVDSIVGDGGVRVTVPIKEPYDTTPIDWEKIQPLPNGDRVRVRFPCSENPDRMVDAK